ncbi:BMP family ABC transporter substrate-binding protein [Bacilliculturomica massiliensis]|uniref:BMP family ABC transporter substrate-binding protein n=1 Tax=Bacilliculturomica massiliensis TaxID=1917867 RepID=UPI0013EF2B07|nr:BMP family ABC transporter substrate-binding protein [Bacilliculturomica massiliensis]
MKKVLAILLALVMVFSFAACGGDSNGGGTDDGGDAAAAELKVGFIFIGAKNDGGYTQAHFEAMNKMVENFGGKVEVAYVENVADTDKQAALNAGTNLMDQNCDVIIGCSYGFKDALAEMAEANPDKYFLHFSGEQKNDSNFTNFFGSIEQARYLSGMVAGRMTKTNQLGYVGAYPYTEVNMGINAFTLGAQAVNPDVQVKVVYINSWGDPELEKAAAEQLLTQGCDVIAQHCDSTAPQLAAQEVGAYAIGYNYDNPVAADAYLTAPVWHHEKYLIPTIQAIMDGTWDNSVYYGTMADGYVDLGNLSDLIPAEVKDEVNAAKEKIASGELVPFTGPITFSDGTVWLNEGETAVYDSVASWPASLPLVKGATGSDL